MPTSQPIRHPPLCNNEAPGELTLQVCGLVACAVSPALFPTVDLDVSSMLVEEGCFDFATAVDDDPPPLEDKKEAKED